MGTFSAKVSAWAAESKDRMKAVRAEAAQNVVSIMQTVGPSVANPGGGAGGAMPVQFGFLRASIRASVGRDLPPLIDNPTPGKQFSYDGAAINLTIAGAPAEAPITVVYVARYAARVEEKYGFTRLAVQRWPTLVAEASRRAQSGVNNTGR